MLSLILTLALSLVSNSAVAASYQQTSGTIVDRIQIISGGGNHAYSGSNLEPGADLSNAGLTDANLTDAELFGANLSGANLEGANLTNAELSGANLIGAILFDAVGLGDSSGSALYDTNTDFTSAWTGVSGSTLFDPVAVGWTLVAVPEPGTALLVGLGLAGLAARRR